MRYALHPEALIEFEEAARYYSRLQPGLDLRFIASVREAVDRIVEEPTRCAHSTKMFAGASPIFFLTAFSTRSKTITCLIVAVSHCSRKPGYWKDRLSR
jgi:hypothetical protein